MQLTRFDRWLREKFLYETHIYTISPATTVPPGVRVQDLPEEPGKRFRHLYIARKSKAADALIATLREGSQMFTTRIVDRKAWYIPYVAPERRSVTWWLISTVVFTILVGLVIRVCVGLWNDPEIRQNLLESIDIFKG